MGHMQYLQPKKADGLINQRIYFVCVPIMLLSLCTAQSKLLRNSATRLNPMKIVCIMMWKFNYAMNSRQFVSLNAI